MCTKNVALTIAGFDPGSGAGITADLKTFAAHDIYGVACVTALTVQSTLGVRSVSPIEPRLVRQTLECLAEDVTFSGVKIGMLGNAKVAGEVVAFLKSANLDRSRVVLDPVLCSSSGKQLLEPNGISVMQNGLLEHVGWITPNVQELAVLAGEGGLVAAAHRLKDMAALQGNDGLRVVVTGGDGDPPTDFLLSSTGEEKWFRGERVETNSTHGTGCAFSSALLCAVIRGLDEAAAVYFGKAYVTDALRAAYPVGKGKGPMHHLFRAFH
jgi:hydroxymethylpyrimidine/phosphomethylpyrimidine kinase